MRDEPSCARCVGLCGVETGGKRSVRRGIVLEEAQRELAEFSARKRARDERGETVGGVHFGAVAGSGQKCLDGRPAACCGGGGWA